MADPTAPMHGWREHLAEAARLWAVEHPDEVAELAACYSTTSNRFVWAAEAAFTSLLPAPPDPVALGGSPWRPNRRTVELAARDGWACHYCGCSLASCDADDLPLPQVEHKQPRSQGGSDDLTNLVLACRPCNSAKGVTPYDVFVASRGQR